MAAYEILLLNTAIPQIQAAQAGDTYVVPRDIAFTSNLTLNAGTANGVVYLNASNVATTGSALTYNGTSFGVGSSNYGNAGTINCSVGLVGTTTGGLQLWSTTSGAHSVQWGDGTTGTDPYRGAIEYSHSDDSMRFYVGAAEKMRLASAVGGVGALGIGYTTLTSVGDSGLAVLGNVGIGTNAPAFQLDVAAARATGRFTSTTGTNAVDVQVNNTGGQLITGIDNSAGSSLFGVGAYAAGLWYTGAYPLVFGTNNTERMRLDSSGNLGLGVTPSAYGTRGFDIAAFVGLSQNSAGAAVLAFNNFQNSAGNYIYKTTNAAARYDCGLAGTAAHAWFTAPSGTANTTTITNGVSYTIITSGNQTDFGAANNNVGTVFTATSGGTLSSGTVSQNISFTQALTLDSTNLTLLSRSMNTIRWDDGTSAPNGTINASISSDASPALIFSTRSSGSSPTERARITSGGKLLVGTTSLYNSNSNTGTYSWSAATGSGGEGAFVFVNTSTSTNSDPNPVLILYKSSTTTSSAQRFIQFYADGVTQPMGGIVGNGATNVQFISLSDAREKENVSPVTGALNRVMQLEVVSFDRKGGGDHVKAGFLAQNVLPIYPEYVVENFADAGQDKRYGITGGMSAGYVAELTAALQELKSELDSVKAELAALKGA